MRRSWLIVCILGGLVMFFQNCAPPMKAAQDQIAGIPADGNAADDQGNYSKLSTSTFDTLTIIDNEKSVDIDLISGRADAFMGSRKGEAYCFQASDLANARAILESAEVCEPLQPYLQEEGRMCSQVYQYAHSAIGKGSQKLMLGERFNGCHIATDLCGEAASLLKAEVAKLKSLLSARACN